MQTLITMIVLLALNAHEAISEIQPQTTVKHALENSSLVIIVVVLTQRTNAAMVSALYQKTSAKYVL